MFLFTISLSCNSYGQTLNLFCEGITKGKDISDSPSSKLIEIDLTTKKIVKVSPLPSACFLGKLQSQKSILYDQTTDYSCISSAVESYLTVNRYNLKLEEVTRWINKDNGKDLFWVGNFNCNEQQKRKF